jgi:hypothetical protein
MYLMDHIDDLISAEIPDPSIPKNQKLYENVIKHMKHGPCGHFNPKCVCIYADKCAKEFPKSFSSQTDTNVNGYPRYIRRDNGIHFLKTLNVIDQFNKKTKIELKVNQRIF